MRKAHLRLLVLICLSWALSNVLVKELVGRLERAGSVCLNSFALPLSGFLPGLRSRCDVIWGATKGGRSPTGVALQMRGEAHAAALCGR